MLGSAIKPILEALVMVDQLYLFSHHVPDIYQAGVRYQDEPWQGFEDFAPVPTILKRGWGDCDDLAPWLVAQHRNAGKKASIRIQWKRLGRYRIPKGPKLFHIVVRRPFDPAEFTPAYMWRPKDGTRTMIEDPSRRLGMRG